MIKTDRPYTEVQNLSELLSCGCFDHLAFQGIDFHLLPAAFEDMPFTDCLFLGCTITDSVRRRMSDSCLEFPLLGMPFKAYPRQLYNARTLYAGFDISDESTFASCYDSVVYKHYIEAGKQGKCIRETLARSIHDHSITDAMYDFLRGYDERDILGVMGGHSIARTDEGYRNIVLISKALTERGKLMVSGGGPGAMEATHLGAWLAGRSAAEVDDALEMIAVAPTFRDPHWLSSALRVMAKYPQERYCSLGVPTWFYGHEPAAPFATHIAKYFDNSVREDGILTIAKGGIIYTPGSAGTLQEIFQDAAQNHYQTFGYASPMVFLGVRYYTEEIPVYPLLKDLLARGRYKNLLLSITDEVSEVVAVLAGEN